MAITIKDIAEAAGVSRGTVDRVLHNRSGVNAEVAQRVRDIAEKLGFVPNRAGKILAARKQPITFACLLPDKENPFFSEVIKGIRRAEKELSDYGVTVSIVHVKGYDPEIHEKAVQHMMEENYGGFCLTTLDTPQVQLAVHKIVERGIPVVSLNTDIPDSGRICYVGTDYFRAGKTASGMLSLTSSENLSILIITGSYNIRGHKERIKGFIAGLDDRNIKYTITDTVESLDNDELSFEQTKKVLAKNSDLNCIFIAAAGVGGVCRAVEECGRNDIRILAFDEVPAVKRNVKKNLIKFTICQEPEMQGYMGIMRLFSWLMEEGKRDTHDFITQTIIKIAENI